MVAHDPDRGGRTGPARGPAQVAALALVSLLLTGCRCEEERGDPGAARRALQSLPYVATSPVGEAGPRRGVTEHRRGLAHPGLSLFSDGSLPGARLIDMAGETVHTWASPAGRLPDEAWHALERHGVDRQLLSFMDTWWHVELEADGALLAQVGFRQLLKLDPRSRILWSVPLAVHHDLTVSPSGDIYTLAAARRSVAGPDGRKATILEDQIVILSPAGKPRRTISVFDALRRSRATAALVQGALSESFADRGRRSSRLKRWLLQSAGTAERRRHIDRFFDAALAAAEGRLDAPDPLRLALLLYTPLDLLHTNTVALLPRGVEGLWRSGDLLVAMRNLDLVAVLDAATAEVRWSWGPGVIELPHQPSMLGSGNILVLDNGTRRGRSRIVEVDPRTRRVVWTYEGSARQPFFTPFGGGCHELPNGDILVTETHRGRAFEVTRRGEIVWEYFHPRVEPDPGGGPGNRMHIYRLTRLPLEIRARLEAPGSPP